MTREEAIEILKSFINVYRICCEDDDSPSVLLIDNDINAFEVAIKALEQEPCEDAISRQAVLDMMNYGILEDNIETMPSVTSQPKWVPVSERLPDDRKTCLVTFKDGYVDIMCYAPDLYKVDEYDFCTKKGKAGWYDYDSEWGYYSRDDVIAWMPLPEPYGTDKVE